MSHQSLKGLTIHAVKTEPPRVAFEQVLDFIENKKTVFASVEYSNQKPAINLNENSALDARQLLHNKIVLIPLKFERSIARDTMNRRIDHENWIAELPTGLKQRAEEANQKDEALEQDWNIPSWKDWAQEEIQKAKIEIAKDDQKKESLKNIIVSSPQEAQSQAEEKQGQPDVKLLSPPPTGTSIEGPIYYQGLPVADTQIDFFHEEDFRRLETGAVDLRKASYNISVQNHQGHLRGVLRNNKGEKIGEGRINLASIDQGDRKMTIFPSSDSSSIHYSSVDNASATRKRKVMSSLPGEKVNVLFASTREEVATAGDGQASIPRVSSNSWSYSRTEGSTFAPSISLIPSGLDQTRYLLREAMIKALKEIVSEQKLYSDVEETGSVVWGQVLLDGKAQSGVSIEAEYFENYKAVYFNALMIPDSNLTATTENGYYAILHLPEGAHNLIAKVKDKYFAHENILTEPEIVTLADLKTSLQKDKVDLKVYDAFTGEPEEAKVEMQSQEEELFVDGFLPIYLSSVRRLSYARVTPNDSTKLVCLYSYSDDDAALLFPTIRESWLRSLKSHRKISDSASSAVIVGFVPEDDFEVSLSYEENFNPENLIFFNSRGEPSEKGEAGGGFVMFNVPYGTQSVLVNSLTRLMRNSQIVPVDQGFTSVLQFRFD